MVSRVLQQNRRIGWQILFIITLTGDIIEESPEKEAEVEKIIGGNRAINYDDVAAFAITNGCVLSIKDDELRLMSPSELDTVFDDK